MNRLSLHKNNKSPKGFTLIELLVVIAIIGVLSSVVLTSLSSARSKANAAKRVSDIHQIRTAIEAYYSSTGGYPSTGNSWQTQCNIFGTPNASWIPNIVPNYITALPSDPNMNAAANVCCYMYRSDGVDFKLVVGYSASPNPSCGASANFSYLTYPSIIDPQRDGGSSGDGVVSPTPADGSGITAWAIYSPNYANKNPPTYPCNGANSDLCW
jgi:type II secretion system protein G